MAICGSYMFGFSVGKDLKKQQKRINDKRRIPSNLLAYL